MITPAHALPGTTKIIGGDYKYTWIDDMTYETQQVFTDAQKENIFYAKNRIEGFLHDFILTARKLGPMMEHSFFLSGGAIGSLLRRETPNDWDIYFFEQYDAERIFNLYENDDSYKNQIKVIDEKYRDATTKDGLLITENATTLKNGIQFIRKHYGQPADVRATFDFVHCLPYYDSRTKKLYISHEQYNLNMSKKLKVNPSSYKYTSSREQKFLNRGWTWP
jgi:hypothetical protein